MFDELDYAGYLEQHPFHEGLGIDLETYEKADRKYQKNLFSTVDPKNKTPFAADLDDLIRLHFLATSRKVTTILEFGVGKSTVVFNDALKINEQRHKDYVLENLRRSNPFECLSVDNNRDWMHRLQTDYGDLEHINLHYSECKLSTFNSRVCTFYTDLPNVCPDLIYLDAPDQFSVVGDVRGISTRHPDRMPMAGDILAFEHFLTPGTLIVIDGRTANARFLHANLQRNWRHTHSVEYDQHYLELREKPLGPHNLRQVEYCLGKDWLDSL